jgi:alpha-galactosidase
MKRLLFFYFVLIGISSRGQVVTIPLETQNNALVLQADEKKNFNIIYFGEKLLNNSEYINTPKVYKQAGDYTDLLHATYAPSGSRNLTEPAISVVHADGNTSLDLRYVSHKLEKVSDDITVFSVVLKDPVYDFQVVQYFKLYYEDDVIEQWSIISHLEKKDVTLHKYASAIVHMTADSYWLTQYHGDWAKEMRPEVSKITHGIKTLDSKLGTRANLFQPSVFMVSLDKPATEDEGTVLYGGLEWSGNFKIDIELDPQDNLRIIAGINNFASPYVLKRREEFRTPAFLHVLSHQGKGEATRKMHRWARKYKILDGEGSRLTLLNNWEATYFDFNEQKLFKLLKDTKELGVDLFLLDDGWFANKYPRNGDIAGLGDWDENKSKLPNGIASLVKEAKNNQVKFGIWIEPEMVNPRSELYEKHPDWVIKQPKREEHYFRNQLVLDLTNPAVQDFVFKVVDDLFTKNPELAYIKWDCNAVIFNAYSANLKNQTHLYIDYVRGLYKVLERIRAKYPKVPMMLCSGGGGRVDYAALQYFTEFWPSDNTDPLERIYIQWEYSHFYPAIATSNHVTEWGKQPLKFRVDVAMMGKLGFDIVVHDLPEKDLKFCQEAIQNYNELKSVIWHGDLYRLSDPKEQSIASLLYVQNDKRKAVLFNYLVKSRYGEGSILPVKFKGLEASRRYKIRETNLYPGTQSSINPEQVYSGDFLMKVGFNPDVNNGRKSVVLVIEEVR